MVSFFKIFHNCKYLLMYNLEFWVFEWCYTWLAGCYGDWIVVDTCILSADVGTFTLCKCLSCKMLRKADEIMFIVYSPRVMIECMIEISLQINVRLYALLGTWVMVIDQLVFYEGIHCHMLSTGIELEQGPRHGNQADFRVTLKINI